MQTYTFQPKRHYERLDIALLDLGVPLSRKKIRAIIDQGGVYRNGKRLLIASRGINQGDTLKIFYRLETLTLPDAMSEHDIVYEDQDLIAINKPVGIPSQPTQDQKRVHLLAWIEDFLKKRDNKTPKLFLVHRLDVDTTGVFIAAKSNAACDQLSQWFKQKSMKKTYLALAAGSANFEKQRVENFLSFIDPKTGSVRVVKSGGRLSLTDFERLQATEIKNKDRKFAVTLFRCFPATGRSHQIRVHLAGLGHPIIGDKKYATSQPPEVIARLCLKGHFLHAESIQLPSTDQRAELMLTAPLPALWVEALKELKLDSFTK